MDKRIIENGYVRSKIIEDTHHFVNTHNLLVAPPTLVSRDTYYSPAENQLAVLIMTEKQYKKVYEERDDPESFEEERMGLVVLENTTTGEYSCILYNSDGSIRHHSIWIGYHREALRLSVNTYIEFLLSMHYES